MKINQIIATFLLIILLVPTAFAATFTKTTDPNDQPGGNGLGLEYNHAGTWLAFASASTPGVGFYNITTYPHTRFTPDVGVSNARDVSWNATDQRIAVASNTFPYLYLYDQSGSTFSNQTITFVGGSPGINGAGVSWNQIDNVIAHASDSGSNRLTLWNVSTNTLTKVTDPGTLPTGNAQEVEWAPNGQFLAVAHSTSPFVSIYQWTGGVLTKLSNPASLPPNGGQDVSWSNDSRFLAVAHVGTPFVTVYERSGTTFTKLTNPTTLPTSTGNGVAWNKNNYLAVAHASSPFVTIYERNDLTLTKVTNPDVLPTNDGRSAAWKPDTLLSVGQTDLSGRRLTTYTPQNILRTATITIKECARGQLNNNSNTCTSIIGNLPNATVHFTAPANLLDYGNQTTNETGVTVFTFNVPGTQTGIIASFRVGKTNYEYRTWFAAVPDSDYSTTIYIQPIESPTVACGPNPQTVLVPAQASFDVSLTTSQVYYTYFKYNPSTGYPQSVTEVFTLNNATGINLKYPIGRPSQADVARNDTGAYSLVFTDNTTQTLETCNFAINTNQTNYSPIEPDQTQTDIIESILQTPVVDIQNQPQTTQQTAKDFATTFAQWAWDDPIIHIPNMWLVLLACAVIAIFFGAIRSRGSD